MADTTGRDGIFDEPNSEEADDFFGGGQREAAPRRGESLDEILRDGASNDRRDESISNIHTGSKEEHISVLESAPPEGAPPPPTPIIEPDEYTPGDPPPPIDPIDVDQEAGGEFQAEERGLDFEFEDGQFREDRVFEDPQRVEDGEEERREALRTDDTTEELILTPTKKPDDDDPTVPSEVDDRPETPTARNAVLDEDDLAGGTDGDGPRAITQPLIIDFGDDGAGDVRLTIPDELREIQAGPENSTLNVQLSADGKTISATDSDGDPVFKVTLDNSGGSYSYTFELQGNVHHGDVDQIDFPIGIAVTDSDGDLAVGEFKVGIVDDEPVARDDETVKLDEGGTNLIGSDNGADNLLANDDVGADGALIFQFTYTDENGEEQTARAGETVDTEHGTLTVNADGSWTFEADERIDHDGEDIVADNFTYSIVDADGDTSSASQSIEITDDGPKISFPPADGDPDGKGDLATLFEDDIAGGNASVTQTLEIDFGADGDGSVALSIPQELEEMGLTADGKPVEFSLSDDGQSIVATAGGEPVFTMSLSEEGGEYSYTFELQGNLDHPDAGSDVLSNLPFDLTVTDGDGSTATAEININVVDDQPEAVGEATLKMEEGDGTVGSGNGGANLLANDDLGADGGEITSFTYTDEAGNQQTADAGQTVDTENGQLTVNADGSWSFTADESADHSDGKVLDGFTYTVTDGDGDTSQATQRIEITDTGPEIPPNDPPTGNPPGEGDQPDLGRADLIVDEDSMGSATQAIEVDFGQDGFGSASLSVPQELQDMNLTSGGEAISYTVSDDGQTITASTPDGEAVFTVTLDANAETGELSYTVDLQGNVDHADSGAGDDLLSNIPVTLTVTDGDGTEASTNLEIGIKDDNPTAADDKAVTLEEGGNTVGSGNGGDNLLANDDVGADGGEITSFTYTDEAGNEQTADAGSTVDTEHGTLTVNADGSWSFESDPNADHSDGAVSDGFTYTITDGDGDTATASQNITVTDTGPEIPPNDPPTGNPPGEGDQPDLGRADLIVDEDSMGAATQAIEVDFGQDGFGSASLSVPQELQDMNLTSGGEAISYSVSDDGQTITASTPDGEAVFTVTLDANAETGEMSYTVDLQGNVDHADSGAGDDLLSNIPVTLTVTDGDGTEASTNLEIGIKDDNPTATDDATVTLDEDGDSLSVSAESGLLSNDDLGADGGQITSFTYTDEAGNQQTADAGSTVDTEHGQLTVNADGSWSFTSNDNIDHGDGNVVTDGFTYTVTDGDGDTASASQSITITDEGPKITPPGGEPGADGYAVTLDEGDLGDGSTSGSQALNIDFGADGEGSVALSVPQELQDMNLTAGGEPVTFTVSEDGQSITGATPDGSPVMTITLNEDGGNYSYSVELSDNLDHTGANGETISDIPVTLTVTDGDGDTASTSLNVNVIDDAPEAANDAMVTLEEGGNTVGSGNGGDNLLANDDVGADGGQITSFTYTDEAGNEQTADAGQTVDTEHGTLTVNADGSWSFESDPNADHADGAVSDGFTYTITDGDGDTATASQNITVTDTGPEIPPNDPPTGNPPGEGDQPDLGRADLIVDEDSMGSATQAIEVDFGSDGFGSAALSVPQELQDMNLTSGGEAISYSVSEDGQTITASTPDGEAVFTVTLDANAETGELSYTVDLQGNVDHADSGAGDDLLSNIPVTLTVTDGDGTEASTNLEIGIKDDNPTAADDKAVTLEEGGNTVGSGNGGDNLLANDDVGADGGKITSFTYTDEAGNEQTADAGSTVDTEHGTLTVNADGSWSFESDPNADHSDGAVSDGFTYTITDGDGDTATASQNITVTDTGPEIPPNDPPTGNPPGEGDQPDLGRADLIVDEDSMGSATQAIEVDFGQDGFGSASLSVPQELQDMNLTSGGEAISYAVSDDGQTITASTPDGEAVFTVTLDANAETGELSYTVDLQGNVDHADSGAGDDLLSNIPVTLTVTDGDGTEASTNLEIGIKDDNPTAADDATVTLDEGGDSLSVSAESGLLSNDDLGADGGQITSFTYTDEAGNQQTAEAGSTVDTENGQLTVNADGSWSFTSDDSVDHSGGAASDGFTYTVTDGDGDTASASQSITITDEGPKITPPGGEPGADGYAVTLDEGDLGDGSTSGSQALNIDFGADGEGSVALSVPQELQDMNLTAGGEPVTFTVSEDGQSITGATPDGSPVMMITLNEDGGNYSYSVKLSDNLDHTGANGETISDIPVTLTVTDGDGDTASTSLNVNVIDDAPEAVDDGTFNVADGGNTIGTDGGHDNLLANDDLGADGAQVTSFTYTDENGETQKAQAGETVDTEQGTLTVNADGTWSFESDDQIESADGTPVMDNFTYTITDGDGDTSTANVTINVSDGTAEPPQLVVGNAIGYEDNAIPINISTSLTDSDGSESLSITISGVPDGATLSAGTDNGDGTWTLEEGDLDGLTVTPPTDSDIDFDLSVSVTSTEASTGETTTVTDTFTVEVDAVADPTTVSATVEAKLVGGEQVTETVTGEGSIDASNFNQEGQGFTVSARTLNADGSLSDASADNVTSQSNGLGVKGSASDGEPDAQLGFNPETETSEQLVIDFDHDVTELSFTVSRLFADEGDGKGDAAGDEQGKWQVYDDGELVAEGTFSNETGNEGTFSIDLPDGVSFNQIVFSGTEYSGGDGNQTQDSSDYFIKEIDFSYEDTVVVEEPEPQCEITVNVDATFGDFTDGSENHFIVVEVPEGWEPQGEYVEVDSSNYGDGNFIAIPVDAEDLQASGGSVSVPVSFLAPAPDADESVELDVFAVAQEVNIDGTVGDGEITLDNNNTMSKATVTVEHKDVVVEDPTLEAEDAQGYEDNAIALDIDAGLTDTDGSESLSITISGVPEGATLSAGTDNGDGTWTLEEGDLDGLTVTPPADSDADFELSVSAMSTESSTGESKTVNTTIDVKVDAVADDTTIGGSAEVDMGDDGDPGMPDIPEYDSALSNVVVYLDDGNGDVIKVRVEDFPGGNEEVHDVNDLDIDGFIADTYPGMTPVAITVKAGSNANPDAGPGEGDLFILDDSVSADDLPLKENVSDDNTFSFGESLEGREPSGDIDAGAGGDNTVTVNMNATFGDYEDGSESHFVFVEVPEGWEAPEGSTVVDGGEVDGLPDKQFIRIEVDNADLQENGGSASVAVTFEVPDDQASGDINFEVFSAAIETPSDGGEITLDNNTRFAGGTVTARYEDGAPTVDAGEVRLDENNLGDGSTSATGDISIDFGADGEGAVTIGVPAELEDMGLTSGGESITFTVSEDGQSITGTTPDGSPVLTITLNEDGGDYSYTVEMQAPLDHNGDNGDLINDMPVTLNVTDGNGQSTSTTLNIDIADAVPEAVDDGTFNVADGGATIGTDGGQDNLLANDDLGADGAEVTSFTYTDENGETQTAQAGDTVDTEQGTLTVNADGTWSFESDEQTESADGSPVMDNFTYTITDSDGDTSSATVTIKVSDGSAQEPELVVGNASGYEDNAIPLNIDANLTDTDGSESLSITISDVPDGATLSAGTDNGDGTWTLEEGDLNGLTVTPPTDSDVDFDLSVSVTSTEASTGETNTVETTFTVEVDAVADDVGVSAEIKATIVPGEGDGGEPETVTIGADNYDDGDSGFTVSGRTLDRDGNLSEGSTDNISVKSDGHPTGFGVKGDASNGADSEIGYEDGKSEQVVIDFDSDVSEANVTIAWQNPNEDCRITLYRDGEPVGEVVIEGGTDGVDSLGVFKADDGGSFDQMVFEATGENSDFLVHEISFEVAPPEPDPVCEVEIDVTATFGDYEDGSEQHFVFVEVPEGMEPTDENAQTVEGNAENGLTTGKTFVVVEVDAEDIEAGGGSVTVPVSFTGPVPEDGGSVTANVFAGAQETNLDGGELTFDNNLKLASTSVESEKGDMTVSDPEMDIDDASGLEDTAIPLDLNISLTDTDGSESMSITIADVPEGATLSAGTDNGDGTWTLEEGDLDGLTITPPHNSDVDFDLKVEVAVTEGATGETKTFTEDVKVEVVADADAPTLDASLSVDDSGDDGSTGGKGQHDNRGHGNNVDGVDDDNPGKGGGGPQAHKEGDGIDEDEGTRGGDGGAGAWRGEGLDNDFVDDGGQNHAGTGGDDTFVVGRDLNMNENFNMGDGDDTVIVNGDTSQGHNFNMGAGDDNLALNGDINGNTAMDGGEGNDVLYLEGDSDQYTLRNFTDNQGHINTQIIDNNTGQTITVNNVEAISFGDGEVVGNADLVDRDAGGDAAGEPTVYDLDIDSALTDLDGSESLTITLGPVPEGVTFSAGTDNGDGTWSLEPEDLQDLQMTVEADVNEDFDLPIKATSTESENGDSESVNMSLKVELPEDHGDPADPPVNNDGSGHGSGQGTGGGKSASGHGTGGASKVAKSGSGHGKGKSGSGQGKSGSGHGRGGVSKMGKSGSGHGKGRNSSGKGKSGTGHGRGGHSKMASSGSGHGKGGDSKHGKGGSGSGHGRGGHSAKGGHSRGGSGHGRGGHSGHGNSGHGRGWGGSGHGHGSGQGIAAAGGGSGHGGPQGNNGFGNGDQDAPGGSLEHNNAENAGGGGGDRIMNALNKFANAEPPTEDGGGDTFRNVGAGRGGGGDDGNWFDEQDQAPVDDDVFGKTEMEQKEEDDQKAEEAQREDEEGGIQIPADDNGGPEADFEDRSLV